MQDNREFIVWGTGMAGRRFLEKHAHSIPIAHVIDGNIQKKGEELLGYVIESPDDIKDWSEYRVVIASTYYKEIKCSLEEKGLSAHRDFWDYNNDANFYTMQELLEQIDTFMDKIREIGASDKPKRIFIGDMYAPNHKNGSCYLNRMAKIDKEHQWIFLSECPFAVPEEWFDSMQILPVPYFISQQKENMEQGDGDEISFPTLDEELQDAALAMQLQKIDVTIERAQEIVKRTYDFYRQVFEILKPDKACYFGGYTMVYRVFAKVCHEAGTDLFYLENGILPGTLTLERHGQMGASDPAVFYEEFQQIDVEQTEREHAEQVLTFLHESGLNRYKQQKDTKFIDDLQSKLLPDRPVILYAGQLDCNAGMLPHNEWAIQHHSPIFETTEEAAVYLRELAEKKQWNLIFKAHPSLPSQLSSNDKGFLCINSGSINDIIDICDLVITIVSSVSYTALIRNKPALMLGYTQLKKKGCTYEAFQENEIERTIEEALEKGFQPEMKEAFINHVARLGKSYLYDDMTEKPICIGKSFEQAVREGEIL